MAVKERSATFRALGNGEPPETVMAQDRQYHIVETYKHDSWAATAHYQADDGSGIVCKFNRQAPIGFIPMGLFGRWLAGREMWFYRKLSDVECVATALDVTTLDGTAMGNVSAHPYIVGEPFTLYTQVNDEYFDHLLAMIRALHARNIAYVDMNKRENMIIDLQGRPNLMDFQLSFAPERFPWGVRWLANRLLPILQEGDIYHVNKHYALARPDLLTPEQAEKMLELPRFIKISRKIGVPIRTFRRSILVKLGIREKGGYARSEVNPEVAFRDQKHDKNLP